MRDHRLDKAPDFTNAALVMGAVNLLWIFAVLWALFGMIAVVLTAFALNAGISRLGRLRGH